MDFKNVPEINFFFFFFIAGIKKPPGRHHDSPADSLTLNLIP